MALVGVLMAFAAGWFGWSYWGALPIGGVIWLGMHQYFVGRADRVAATAVVTAPAIALVLMWCGGRLGSL